MEALKQWAVCLIICGIGASVISLLSPRGTMEKTLRAVIGVFVVSAVCMPLAKLKSADELMPAFVIENNTASYQSLEAHMIGAYKDTVEEIVAKTAEETGVYDYDVDAEFRNEEGCIIIQHIHIKMNNCDSASAANFGAALQEKLGVKVSVECV